MSLHQSAIDTLTRWQPADPAQESMRHAILAFLDANPKACLRESVPGHITGSALVLNHEGTHALLTLHPRFGRWLQLGGHADGDEDLARGAGREAEEESGLSGLRVEPAIFDLDRHWIPERKDVPSHWHYDVRFVVHAGEDEAFVVSEESLDLAWRDIAMLGADEDADDSLRRMARRWLARAAR